MQQATNIPAAAPWSAHTTSKEPCLGPHPHVHEAKNLRAHMRVHLKQLIKLALSSTQNGYQTSGSNIAPCPAEAAGLPSQDPWSPAGHKLAQLVLSLLIKQRDEQAHHLEAEEGVEMLRFKFPPAGQGGMRKRRSAQRPMCPPDFHARSRCRHSSPTEQSLCLSKLPQEYRTAPAL